MDELGYDAKSKSAIERIVLAIFTWFLFGMIFGTVALGMSAAYIVFFAAGAVFLWAAYLGKYKDYTFRAFFDAAIILTTTIVHVLRLDSPLGSWPTYLLAIVLLGLFGIPNVIKLSFFSTTIVVIYHLIATRLFTREKGWGSNYQLLILCVTAYIVSYVIHEIVRKQIEAQEVLLQNIDEVSEMEREKDDFLTNVSHELRTPVNIISGMAELLREDETIPEAAREKLDNILIASANLNASVSDILDFSELQSNKMTIQEAPYDVTSVIDDVIELSSEKYREKNLEFIINFDADVPVRLMGDETKLRRIIMNIVGNAIKFTTDGCVVLGVSTRKTEYGVNLNIYVRDTGKGMKKEALEKIFTSFAQVDTKRNRSEGGIGLGLAICKALIDKMGGNIMVESTYGKGTRVWFSIPQRVVDETAAVYVRDRKSRKIAFCAEFEHLRTVQVRDSYMENIQEIMSQLEVEYRFFRDIGELKRATGRMEFSHIFVTLHEYKKDVRFFDALLKRGGARVTIIMDRKEDKPFIKESYHRLYKPFYSLQIADILNMSEGESSVTGVRESFIAPEAQVLVVDDNRMNIAVIEGLMKRYQIQTTGALSGYEALEKIERMCYDVVFMDHMMPEMDGVETFHAIRQKSGSYFRDVPIIALTANVVAGTRDYFMEEGFTDYVSKPVEPFMLEQVLRSNIPQTKQIAVQVELHKPAASAEDKNKDVQENGQNPPVQEEQEEKLGIEKFDFLDVKEALKYCGDEDGFLNMVRINYEDAAGSLEAMEQEYAAADWKNYTIHVHALKSSMKTIGAQKLSEEAAGLEQAGKAGDAEYIEAYHKGVMDKYRRLIDKITATGMFAPQEAPAELEEQLAELSEEQFGELLTEFEDQVYAINVEKMEQILEELSGYSYRGSNLRTPIEALKHKVALGDYISAFDKLASIKENPANG